MGQIPKNHKTLYFDKLNRTQKGETVLSLIQATYHSWESNKGKDINRKEDIALRLKSAYNLFRNNLFGAETGAGTYNGDMNQFESQYTIGHEFGIWENSDLKLTKLAEKVGNNVITIRDYFDIILLNYFQPINNKVCHTLYEVLKYMDEKDHNEITKEEMVKIFSDFSNPIIDEGLSKEIREHVNSLFNILISSNYFTPKKANILIYSHSYYSLKEVLKACNIKYITEGYNQAKIDLNTEEKYSEYLNQDHRPKVFTDNFNYTISNMKLSEGENYIIYGVPGVGKSYYIKNNYLKNVSTKFIERIVFHPDYTNSEFVGHILPIKRNGKLEYNFKPGPFTRILKKSLLDEDNMYYLVIEEINRGNAPSIFGEIFQLLDRDDETGMSEYGIKNENISMEIYSNPEKEIKMPGNLTILATMNTADQNVFTLDTAFQRRWNMKMIKNDFNNHKYKDLEIFDTGITWEEFVNNINSKILENSSGLSSIEDKRLGSYFMKEKELKDIQKFSNKVIKYLWDDAFRYNRDDIFEEKYKSLEEVIEDFEGEARMNVFKSIMFD